MSEQAEPAMSAPAHAGEPARWRALRIYGNLRTAHLERFRAMEPATVIYRRARYDFDLTAAPAGLKLMKLSRTATVRHLLRHGYDVVEVNEPLTAARWGDLLFQVFAIRFRAAVTRRPTSIVSYCIGYSDPAVEMTNRRRYIPGGLARVVTRTIAITLVSSMERLAFGTGGSRELYRDYVGQARLAGRSALFEGLPAACTCDTDPPTGGAVERRRVIFVGAFDRRKGVQQLIRAWDALGDKTNGAELVLMGKGALTPEVTSWAEGRPGVELVVDPPREQIHRSLRRSDVLVLLSQPVGGWREQIGLPILEGLSHGLKIVATDQTGLADWLDRHGHTVIPADSAAQEMGRALMEALEHSRTKDSVLADLPATDQRLAADEWLLRGVAS